MAAATLFAQPFFYAVDADGIPLVGAQISVFIAGTDTPQDVYTDPDLMTAWDQPILTNAAGQSDGPIYVDQTPALKVQLLTADDVPVDGWPVDDWSPYALGS